MARTEGDAALFEAQANAQGISIEEAERQFDGSISSTISSRRTRLGT